jgi:predicted DNA binding CopG/RHH family protein
MSDKEPAPYLDLEELDYFTFGRIAWEAQPKTARVSLRLPPAMLAALRERAAERGISCQRLIRESIQRTIEEGRTP